MLPTAADDDCDDCVPDYLRRSPSTIFIALLPFLATFLIVATAVLQRLFPLLSGQNAADKPPHHDTRIPSPSNPREAARSRLSAPSAKRIAAFVFSTNIALSAVLVELILCEISNALNPAARSLALKITLSSLIFSLVLVTPALELHSVVQATGWTLTGPGKGRLRVGWLLEGAGLSVYLLGFWYLGRGLLGSYLHEKRDGQRHGFREGCLERIGVIGIASMACLAGFAAVSSLWQTFVVKTKMVTEADIARKQAGLTATQEMLLAKQSRLRAVQSRLTDTHHQEGFMTRVIGSIRGNAELQERQALQLEVSGLETMSSSLSSALLSIQNRRAAQLRAKTALGHILNLFSYIFACYCLYRIAATTLTTLRRYNNPSTSFANSDPINNVLALLAKHWDPSIDRAAWSRQISFLLSGVMLLLAFNSVLQTFLLFARLFPSLLFAQAQTNVALIISQICATYVISSALLMRSNLPPEYRGVVSEALGARLESGFVERWFEGWFLGACAVTGVGVWAGRRLGVGQGLGEWDEDGDLEVGKMS